MQELPPFTSEELANRLERQAGFEFNQLAPDDIAAKLAPFSRQEQEQALRMVAVATKGHAQIGYQVGMHADVALKLMQPQVMEAWVMHALDLYDRVGLFPAIASVKEVEYHAREAEKRSRGVVLRDISGVLSLFIRGLAGRELKILEDETPWTDTQHVHLPSFLGRFESKEDNFYLYKAMIVYQWAQTWFGTWLIEGDTALLCRYFAVEDEKSPRLQQLLRLESIRLDPLIKAELPGIHREMCRLRDLLGEQLVPTEWEAYVSPLLRQGASVRTSLGLLSKLTKTPIPKPLCYEGVFNLRAVSKAVSQRIEAEKHALQQFLWDAQKLKHPELRDVNAAPKFDLQIVGDARGQEGLRAELRIDAKSVPVPRNARETISSIMQDFSEIPADYLQPVSPGQYDTDREGRSSNGTGDAIDSSEGAFFYDEWDFKRQNYRDNWCVLREVDVKPGDSEFARQTLNKYAGLVKHIRRSFEVLRSEDAILKRQPSGENIDIEAFVGAWADARIGREMSDRLYARLAREERSIAVMLMVDMSGSTHGWINDAERESLILLCEALETLGDRYAIYGFSGWARKRCEIFPVKRFDEDYNEDVIGRVAGIQPQDYTRMGAAIRHLTGLMKTLDVRTRILITLSDGKPEDYDDYGGQYGIEDTRMALLDARRSGIHPFCITIDRQGQDYLPYMYGQTAYVVIDEVGKLPFKVADIYRKLTT